MVELRNCNIVVVANNLNPSIFSQLWLVKNKIFNESDFLPNSFFTQNAVSVNTENIQLLVVPERVQFTFNKTADNESLINNVLRKIINLLPQTPYTAVGFNFEIILEPRDFNEYPKIIRNIFVSDNNPLAKFFNTENSRFGMVMTKENNETQITLNIKPVVKTLGSEKKEALKFTFNFNKNLSPENAVETINLMLDDWVSSRDLCYEIIKEMGDKWTI
jgi:hypothetical protein